MESFSNHRACLFFKQQFENLYQQKSLEKKVVRRHMEFKLMNIFEYEISGKMVEVRENKVLIVSFLCTSIERLVGIVSHLQIINTCVVIRIRQHHFRIFVLECVRSPAKLKKAEKVL